ncbi:unnamed protein product [Ilex paraguariensis]|uniref:Uncharacterized protein n=1 Tax=Ilex paraguariensis TaxID=185542 RepID=A0ABC8RTS5_9AQUA
MAKDQIHVVPAWFKAVEELLADALPEKREHKATEPCMNTFLAICLPHEHVNSMVEVVSNEEPHHTT